MLETDFETSEGAARVIDFMPRRGAGRPPRLMRIVQGLRGRVSALARTEAWWRDWSGRCAYQGRYHDEVLTSLIVLEAMTFETTGDPDDPL